LSPISWKNNVNKIIVLKVFRKCESKEWAGTKQSAKAENKTQGTVGHKRQTDISPAVFESEFESTRETF
jgi:hypothetical protein